MEKVLIITYYWPPSGGAGVQRWVKLTKYLKRYDIAPHVLTVHEKYASYMNIDESLNEDVSPDVKVYKTKSVEALTYYSKLIGKKNVPTAGFTNVNYKKLSQKIISSIRSNLFIPDPRKGWNKYAFKKAVEIIKKENIKFVITTSPPHSTQLIGFKLQNMLDVKWIADLRDPWTDIYYYKLLGHSFLSKSRDRHLEKKVLINADKIITVSDYLKHMFSQKDPEINPSKIHVIPNGYDNADFVNISKERNKEFTICYTGTMSDIFEPAVLFQALKQLLIKNPDFKIKLQIVGQLSDTIKNEIMEIGLNAEFIPTVPHNQVNKYQVNADLLLLVIPNVKDSIGILTGKLFEYLASGNNILCIGPESSDTARIIQNCNIGQTFERDKKQAIADYIEREVNAFHENTSIVVNREEIEKFSREKQAGTIKAVIDQLYAKN